MIGITVVISTIVILLSYFISHRSSFPVQLGIINDESERRSQYECGIEVFEENIGVETRERFYIKFYIIGILFLIFDLETLLLYPFALILTPLSCSLFNPLDSKMIGIGEILLLKSFFVFLIFIIILILGLVYEYRKKVL